MTRVSPNICLRILSVTRVSPSICLPIVGVTRVSPSIRCPILRKACVSPSLCISSLGVTRVSPSISFPILCPSSHVCCWGFVCSCTCWQKLVWVPSGARFDHGTHMQAHPGPVRIAQGVMLEITHSTMIKRGKLMGQHSRVGHC